VQGSNKEATTKQEAKERSRRGKKNESEKR
jgi:hypothetical protein